MDKYGKEKEQVSDFSLEVKKRSDKLMNYFLISYFIAGLVFAFYFDTWLMALAAGGLSLLAYYSVKTVLPHSNLYQYVLSTVLGVFMAQYIYQMHGMFEMHFFAFIGSAILITYQNWKLQIPLVVVVVVHHATFGYLQNIGYESVYFTQLDSLELNTFIIHIILAAMVFFISGLWAYQLKKYTEIQIGQTLERQNAEHARAEAEQANQAKSAFLATMSHEIRTPMNGVIGMASLLAGTSQTSEQQEYTETIQSCGESLLVVINDILDYSKIESGKMELEQKAFNLRTCIEEVLDVFSCKASQLGLDLIYEIDYNVPSQIVGDSVRLRQVIMNLVGNAVKFTHEGEIFLGVHLLNANGDHIELGFEIRDTGIGISDDKIDRLFKAFSQVDSSTTRKYGGTGLGLVICEKLVGLMGGTIVVESNLGQGTTFTFSIQSSISHQSSRRYVHHSVGSLEGKKVLVVDDNSTNRTILKNQLEQWKLVPTLATSGKEALAILLYADFDLVLTDMQMPEMDGLQVAKHIRDSQNNLPIILLSSADDDHSRTRTELFSSVLTKPVKQSTLHEHILTQLGQREKPIVHEVEVKKNLSIEFAQQHPLSILIAEDNSVNQKLAERVLIKLGYKPVKALNGQEVLDALDHQHYDIILMDVQMPVMDGLEATRRIRLLKEALPVIIAMTANAMQGDKEVCLEAGMNDYISKPIKPEDLVDMLEKWATPIKDPVYE